MSRYRDLSSAFQEAQRVEELFCARQKMRHLSPKIYEFSQLKKLVLSYNRLDDLPDSITQLPYLETLDLDHNAFRRLPSALFQLENLQHLNLSHNLLQEIPDSLAHLQALKTLNLEENNIQELPKSLVHLKNLTYLNLSKNKNIDLEHLAQLLASFKQHIDLNLSHCDLFELPENFAKIQNLRSLNIGHNPHLDLEKCFHKLKQLPKLQSLNIENTQAFLPKNLEDLKSLSSLRYDHLDNRSLAISNLGGLKELEIQKSEVRKIPTWFANLSNLETLKLAHNKLQALPTSFSKLKNLKYLDLRHNQFHQLPPNLLRNIYQFEEIKLAGNHNIPNRVLRKFCRLLSNKSPHPALGQKMAQIWSDAPQSPELVKNSSLADLIKILQFNSAILSKNTLANISKPPSRPFKKGDGFYLAANSKRYSNSLLKSQLIQRGFRVYSPGQKVNWEAVDYLVLSEKIGKSFKVPDQVQVQVISDEYVQDYLAGDLYLSLSERQIQKVNQLLISEQESNHFLALQMLQSYCLPRALWETLIAFYLFSENRELSQLSKSLIFKFLPYVLQAKILWLEELEPEFIVNSLIQSSPLHPGRLANTAFQIAGLGPSHLLAQGGPNFEQMIRSNINYRRVLSLRLPFDQISEELKEMQDIHHIEIIGSMYSKEGLRDIPPVIFEMPWLRSLRIDDTQLNQISPKIALLQNLEKLRLANNHIHSLPPEIGELKKLKVLTVFNNQLREIPNSIAKLTDLQELWLFSNQIEVLPEEIGKLKSLLRLHLSSNRIHFIPPEIGHLHNLQEISLSGNPLEKLPPEIGNLHKLQKLELRKSLNLRKHYEEWLHEKLPACSVSFHY